MPPAIHIESLSKMYYVRHAVRPAGGGYRTVREELVGAATAPWRKLRGLFGKNGAAENGESSEQFWALKDVSFDVQTGDRLGIIGRNGAGKSTLLKLLSRITSPTTGRATINGRVGSLLEVGTGFHPELTGRENVYLNGSILGMSRREIASKFDEIVEFSGVEKFLDTPVKRFSSGMQVRLGFAVAAHLDPEILIVDEVLAVGDAEFQRRCISRMQSLAESGTTLLFVSHNLEMIPTLCQRAILLQSGRKIAEGNSAEVVSRYLTDLAETSKEGLLEDVERNGSGMGKFVSLNLLGGDGIPQAFIRSGDNVRVVMEIELKEAVRDLVLAVSFKTLTGTKIVSATTTEQALQCALPAGRHRFECLFRSLRIRPGRKMCISLWMHNGSLLDHIDMARTVDVLPNGQSALSARPDQGAYLCEFEWQRC